MRVAKDYRPLLKRAKALGCTIEPTRKHHLAITTPSGARVICPGTPSDHRCLKNTTAELRRAGVAI